MARRALAVGVVCASLVLTGCGADPASPAAAAGPAATAGATPAPPAAEATVPVVPRPAAPSGATKASLRRAAQQYASGLLRGDFKALAPYLDRSCTPEDRAGLILALGSVKRLARGATLTITGTRVVGRRGNVTAYRLSAKAPPELRRVLDESLRQATSNPWRYVGGRWRNTGPCSGGSAVPGAGTGPTRTA